MEFGSGDLVSFSPDLISGSNGEFIGIFQSKHELSETYVIEVLYRLTWRNDGSYTLRPYSPSTNAILTVDLTNGFINKTDEEFSIRFRINR